VQGESVSAKAELQNKIIQKKLNNLQKFILKIH